MPSSRPPRLLLATLLAGCVTSTVAPSSFEPVSEPNPAAQPSLPPVVAAPPPVVAPPPPAEPAAEPAPTIPPNAHFTAIRSDPAPPGLVHDSHYWVSNEHSHFVWHEQLQGLGGAFLGVGTDQNYLLAGWSRAELLLLVDFDASIVDLHKAYRVAFDTCETPAEFLQLWSKTGADTHVARITAAYPDPAEQASVLRAQRIARQVVHARLRRTIKLYATRGIPTFLDDQAQYDHLRGLWRDGRVVAVRGDLTGDATLVDVAAALRAAEVPLTVLYLSNAEQYFDYVPSFRRNMLALPLGERSVVLRTLGWRGHGFIEGEQYHYASQAGPNFAEWLRLSRVTSAGKMLAFKRMTPTPGLSVIDAAPKPAKRPPEIAEQRP